MSADPCPVCGGALEHELSAPDPDDPAGPRYELLCCVDCGLGVTRPRMDAEALAAAYRDGFFGEAGGWMTGSGGLGAVRRWLLGRRVRAVRRHLQGGRLLDVGCGDGGFLESAAQAGFEVCGLEPAEAGLVATRARAIEVRRGSRPDLAYPGEIFDLVTLWHVLEHEDDPAALLRSCASVLRPGGLLLAAVPGLDSLQARLGGARWFHLDLPRHRVHFGRESLLRVLERAGFELLEMDPLSLEHGLFGALQTALNMVTRERNLLYRLLRRGTPAWPADAEARRDRVRLLLGLWLLGPASLGLALVEAALGRGGAVVAMARRR